MNNGHFNVLTVTLLLEITHCCAVVNDNAVPAADPVVVAVVIIITAVAVAAAATTDFQMFDPSIIQSLWLKFRMHN